MAKTLSLDIAGDWLLAVEARGGATGAAHAAFAATMPVPLVPENAKELGKWLREQLAESGISAGDVHCTVNRQRAMLKPVTVPACPDNELPAIVQFAVEGEWSHAAVNGEAVLDFQAGPAGAEERDVLAAAMLPGVADAIKQMVTEAGLTPKSLGLRPFSTHYAWRSLTPEATDGIVLLVVAGEESLDMSVWSGDYLHLCRSVPVGHTDVAKGRIASEARRTLAAFHSRCADANIDHIVVCGGGQTELVEALADATGLSVEQVDFDDKLAGTGVDRSWRFAAALGSAWIQNAGAARAIDFWHPKKPIIRRDPRKGQLALIAALILLAPISLYAYAAYLIKQEDAAIKMYADELQRLKDHLKTQEPMLAKHEAIKKWDDERVDPLHELRELAIVLPDTTEIYLEKVDLRAGQSRSQARLSLKGRARSEATIFALRREWIDADDHHVVLPGIMETDPNGTGFDERFDADLEVTPLSVKGYHQRAAELAKDSPPKKIVANMNRVPVSLGGGGSSTTASRTTNSAASSSSASSTTGSPPARFRRRPDRSSRDRDASRSSDSGSTSSASTPSSSSASGAGTPSAESSGGGSDPVSKLVESIKSLPFEEREKKIEEAPSFLRSRIRKALKDSQ